MALLVAPTEIEGRLLQLLRAKGAVSARDLVEMVSRDLGAEIEHVRRALGKLVDRKAVHFTSDRKVEVGC